MTYLERIQRECRLAVEHLHLTVDFRRWSVKHGPGPVRLAGDPITGARHVLTLSPEACEKLRASFRETYPEFNIGDFYRRGPGPWAAGFRQPGKTHSSIVRAAHRMGITPEALQEAFDEIDDDGGA